ncbi:MAG: hypothetical protein IKT33_01655 [Clostridia bacterium]|nr:hypothetical protein [Clostridia bacterium]
MQKVKLFFITTVLLCAFNVFDIVAYADEYKFLFSYYPRYTSNNSYTDLSRYSQQSIDYKSNNWTNTHTYNISSNSTTGIYSITDMYNNYTFSVKGTINSNNNIDTFKIYNSNVYYELYPDEILTVAKLQGTLVSYLDDSSFSNGYTTARLEGKNRTSGEWTTLKTFQLKKGQTISWNWESTDDNPSINYNAYRINFALWNWNSGGLTLIENGNSKGIIDICSCDFSGEDINNWEEEVKDLADLQSNTLLEVKSIGDLVKSVPTLILDGIYDLFVPSDLSDTMEGYINELLDSMGILGFPFELAYYQLNAISNYNPDATIKIPSVKFMDSVIMPEYSFNLNTIGSIQISSLNMSLIAIVRMLTSLLLIYSIANISKSILADLGILKSDNEDLGGGNV